MQLLSVGLTGATNDLRSRLETYCDNFVPDGYSVVIDETIKGNYTFLDCKITEGELSFPSFEKLTEPLKMFVGKMLADIIITNEESKIVRQIIDDKYSYFTSEEKAELYNSVIAKLGNNSFITVKFDWISRREWLTYKIIEYFENCHELVLDGFVKFRLKDYRIKMADMITNVADDYMMDLEYKEFIRVLKYFVNVQSPRIDEVHVIIGDTRNFKILDSSGKAINNQYLESFVVQNGEEINYDDLLVSALITIAPYKVVMHGTNLKAHDALDTIKSIFDGRVSLCEGCERCNAKGVNQMTPTKNN